MRTVFIYALILLLTAGCSPALPAQAQDLSQRPIRITATTGMTADLVQAVGGERVEVTALMGAGVDPHLYRASESDVRALENADLIFYSGLHLEAGLANVLERMGTTRPVIAVTDNIPRDQLFSAPNFQNNFDPHVWFDVKMWSTGIDVVAEALIKADPANTELYRANASAYHLELAALDEEIRAAVAKVPEKQRVLITAHDAFGYFGRAYGFDVRGLQGISTESEAGTADVKNLVDFIVENKIPAIFMESSVPKRNIEAVQAAAADRGWPVKIGGQLYSDAPGSPGTPEGTYPGMVRANVTTIVTALTATGGN